MVARVKHYERKDGTTYCGNPKTTEGGLPECGKCTKILEGGACFNCRFFRKLEGYWNGTPYRGTACLRTSFHLAPNDLMNGCVQFQEKVEGLL